MKTDRETRDVLIIRADGNVPKFARGQEGVNCIRLARADFQKECTAGGKAVGGGVDEAADEVESVGSTVERADGVVADFGGERGDFVRGNVREVGDDEVELGVVRREEVGLMENDAIGEGMARGVFLGEGKGVGREVGGVDGSGGEFEGEGDRDDAAAGADVEEVG